MGISRIVGRVGVRGWGVLAVLVVHAAAAVALWQSYRDVHDRAERRIQSVAQSFAQFTARSFDGYDQILVDVQALLDEGVPANILGGYLRRQRGQHVNLLNLFIFDPQGGIAAGTQDRAADLSDRDYVVAHRAAADVGRFIGRPSVSRLVPGRRFFPMSRRLSAANGDFAGVVAATVDLKELSESFEAAREGAEGPDIAISLVHRDGTLYVRAPAANDMIGRNVDPAQPLGDDAARIVVQRQVPRYPLVVVVGIAHGQVMGQWSTVAVPVAAAAMVATIAIWGLGAHLTRQGRVRGRLRAAAAAAAGRAEAALTTLVQAQTASQRSHKMAVLGEILADAVGEVRPPLSAVQSAAAKLAQDIDALRRAALAGPPESGAVLAYAATAADGMRHVLTGCQQAGDMVAAITLVAGDQVAGGRRTFNLGRYVVLVLSLLRPRLVGLPHRIDVYMPDDIDVDSFPGALAQVVIQLVRNSLAHGFEDGRSGVIDMAARLDGDQVELVYSDNGIGIPTALHAQVFQPFFTTSAEAGHSGLGLAIVEAMVTRVLGGTLTLDSQAGRGVHYTLRFPRRAGGG